MFDTVVEQYHKSFKQLLHVNLYTTNEYLMLIPDNESKATLQKIFDTMKQQFEQIGSIYQNKTYFKYLFYYFSTKRFHITSKKTSSFNTYSWLIIFI